MSLANDNKIKTIGEILNNEDRPLKERFRALFTLKNIGGPTALACINQCFDSSSVLLKHELAYCLGQMQDENAIPYLTSVLEDKNQDPMVRHEAGEALGAIGTPEVLEILQRFTNDSAVEVAETCQLALERVKWLESKEKIEALTTNPYSSIDPAPPASETNIENLKNILLDENKSLFERYRVMFSLRNMNNVESALALTEGLFCGSALFRHEIAFVLGQLQCPETASALQKVLDNEKEHDMVRHECAEALGAIASPECLEALQPHLKPEVPRVVRESCEVALDMCEYENSTELQYANTLLKV